MTSLTTIARLTQTLEKNNGDANVLMFDISIDMHRRADLNMQSALLFLPLGLGA